MKSLKRCTAKCSGMTVWGTLFEKKHNKDNAIDFILVQSC